MSMDAASLLVRRKQFKTGRLLSSNEILKRTGRGTALAQCPHLPAQHSVKSALQAALTPALLLDITQRAKHRTGIARQSVSAAPHGPDKNRTKENTQSFWATLQVIDFWKKSAGTGSTHTAVAQTPPKTTHLQRTYS